MISLLIENTKQFMNQFLVSDCFDAFLLEEAVIATAQTYVIDGHINKAFFSKEELEDTSLCPYPLSVWSDMRSKCFDLIKGKRTPVSFKFVLHLKPDYVDSILQKYDSTIQKNQVEAFVLTIKYDGTSVTCTSGTSLSTFLLDKSADIAWDKALEAFFIKKTIL